MVVGTILGKTDEMIVGADGEKVGTTDSVGGIMLGFNADANGVILELFEGT